MGVRGKVRARPLLTVVVLVVVLAVAGTGAWWFWLRADSSAADTAATPTITTTDVDVTTGTITKSVEASGTLAPAVQESVGWSSSAEITAVDVAVGDTVTAGQTLGTIDTVALKADLASAKATLAQAQAQADSAQTAVEDAADTDDSDTEGTTDDETAAAQLAAAQAQVTSAKQQVDSAQESLDGATLTSPVAGVVAEVNVAVGDTSSGSSGSSSSSGSGSAGSAGSGATGGGATESTTSTSSSSSFLIVGTDKWTTSVTVDDSQINLIKKGIQAQLTVDGQESTLFGKVTSVGLISTSTSDTASYPVTVAVTGSPEGLHDGSAATVTLIYQQLTDVLVVPSAAITTSGGTSTVQKVVDGQAVATTVEIGESSGTSTQIVSGLAEGDQVQVTTVARGAGQGGTGQGGTGGTGGFPGGGTLPDGVTLPDGATLPGGGTGGFPGGGTGGQGGFTGGQGGFAPGGGS
ncbi:HlyD family efflux transporter periplasmic adaptor subunit [Nakamurella sp. YIM 132087]|uniref:HlyD family efflux transporter periplasmic adaptor subunit n=1 Tax=Nakamurella alba TaxID=2665158 RepID=A0A7K1FIL6_9ACTN|nr:biotin/lipoyl-binding protein [Nakamurella alba]MTD13948.1 HlyD family efflux transporter periplasmic adaptor subunit [Nakamurella alba]